MSGSKLLRLFSLFLCLLLCLANFSVVASAAVEENLVSSDLRTWLPGSGVDSTLIDPYQFFYDETNNFNRVNIEFPLNESIGVYMGDSILYELPEIQVSETYQFSFTFPSLTTIQTLFPHITDSSSLQSFFGSSLLTIGIGFINPATNKFEFYEDCYFEFSPDDIPVVIGKTFTQTFNLKQIKGVPFFGISIFSSSQRCSFFIQDVSLIKVQSENDKKLDGILGWLQELWNSIKDGFSNLGGKLSELGSSITDNFNRFWDSISERLDVSEGYLVEIKSFFHDLYWDLVGGTCKYGDEHTSLFERLGNRIGGFFDDMKLKIDLKVEEIKTSIHDFFVPPEDFFDNWKTRFNAMLEHNLGFVYQAPNFVIQVVNCIQDVINTKTEPNLVFPKVEFDIVGYHVVLFEYTAVDFSFLESGIWATVYGMYKVMVHAILAFALIKFAQDTWERTMSN